MEVVARAFLSYAHEDNEREGGRILHLADLIRREFESLTGATIQIFTDSAEILWGQDFRARLSESIQETTFFIPVLSPTYFMRDECRSELRQFVTSASSLGLEQLLLSIRYFQVPDLREGSSDELKDIAARMQFEPWDSYRLLDESGERYRTAVNKLATRLVQLTENLEGTAPLIGRAHRSGGALITPRTVLREAGIEKHPVKSIEDGDEEDDAPGLIDLVSDVEPAIADWSETVTKLGPATQVFNDLVAAATAEMAAANSRPNSFAAKIVVSKKLAADAEEPLATIEQLSKEYSVGLIRVDPALRALLQMVDAQPASKETTTFVNSIQSLIDNAIDAAEKIRTAAEAAKKNSGMSRDLRPILRRFETALRNVADGTSTIQDWQPLIDATGSGREGVTP